MLLLNKQRYILLGSTLPYDGVLNTLIITSSILARSKRYVRFAANVTTYFYFIIIMMVKSM